MYVPVIRLPMRSTCSSSSSYFSSARCEFEFPNISAFFFRSFAQHPPHPCNLISTIQSEHFVAECRALVVTSFHGLMIELCKRSIKPSQCFAVFGTHDGITNEWVEGSWKEWMNKRMKLAANASNKQLRCNIYYILLRVYIYMIDRRTDRIAIYIYHSACCTCVRRKI